MYRILVADTIAEAGVALLREQTEVVVDTGLTPEDLLEIIPDFEGLVVRSGTRVTAEVIEAGQRLRVIGRAGVGIDNIDLDAARAHGVAVVNSPYASTVSVAEHALGMMLALARRIPQADTSLRRGEWLKNQFKGIELAGKTLGIIGLGRIGSAVAERARAFGMTIIAHDPYIPPQRGVDLDVPLLALDDLLRQSDFVTIHTPLSDSTRGLIGYRELTLMKSNAYLILCARGGIVDEAALLSALEEDRLAGAALDVFEKEPPGDNSLLASDKVIATPHIGAMTEEAQVRAGVGVAEQVLAVFNGERPEHLVVDPHECQ